MTTAAPAAAEFTLLKGVTLSHDRAEDRITLTGSDNIGRRHVLMLTRRMVMLLLPKLLQRVDQVDDAPVPMGSGQRAELQRMRHLHAVQSHQQKSAKAAPAAEAAPAAAAATEPAPESAEAPAKLLVNQVALSDAGKSLVLKFYQDAGSPELTRIVLDLEQTHCLIAALYKWTQHASWELPATSLEWLHEGLHGGDTAMQVTLH